MSGYTVTITPAGDQSGPQTTIHVDTASGAARVVELTVRAAGGDGLAPQQLPVIDLAGLIAALTPPTAQAITATEAPPPAGTAAAPATGRTRSRAARGSRGDASRAEASAPARKRVAKARTTESAGPRKSAATRGRRRQAAEATAEPRTGRAYRRMPDQAEVVAAYQ